MLRRLLRRKQNRSDEHDGQGQSGESKKEIDYAKSGKPPGCKRLLVAISFALFLVAGIPIWWKTTEINRPVLPSERISAVRDRVLSEPLRLPVLFTVYLVNAGPLNHPSKLAAALRQDALSGLGYSKSAPPTLPIHIQIIEERDSQCSCVNLDPTVHGGCTCLNLSERTMEFGRLTDSELDKVLGEALGAKDESGAGKAYLFVFASSTETKVRVGSQRHAWMWLGENSDPSHLEQQLITTGVKLMKRCFANGNEKSAEQQGDALPLSASSEVLLSFALCNSDPSPGYWVWDFEAFEAKWIRPVMAKLEPVLHSDVESQVLYHTTTEVQPVWSKQHDMYVLKDSDLPFFVNSKWQLDSGRTVVGGQKDTRETSPDMESSTLSPHVLHWVVFIPPAKQSPLGIVTRKTNKLWQTNAFSVHSWGGVQFLNQNLTHNQSKSFISEQDYAEIASVFVSQWRKLLGLGEVPFQEDGENLLALPAEGTGFADWEVDVLMRKRAAADVAAAVQTLNALDRLMAELPNLEMPDFIGYQVEESLTAVEKSLEFAQSFNYEGCRQHSRRARQLAEEAFAHPSILAQLNFPDQHKVALYLPLLLPVLLAATATLVREVKRFAKRRSVSRAWRASHHQKSE